MTSAGLPLKFRMTHDCRRGECNQMKNTFCFAKHGIDPKRLEEYVCFGIFDGHDGPEAAQYAKDHLLDAIISQKKFSSDEDSSVLNTIRKGFVKIHYDMWKIHETWPRRADQFYSTSGTSATVVFIKNGKMYTAHVGDSRVVLGYQNKGDEKWKACILTTDHKPDTPSEMSRIKKCGGKVITSSGTSRVVWRRPSLKHKGPGSISHLVDEIPFSALSRSLGDLWSYNCKTKEYVVSPEPNVVVHTFNAEAFRCLIIATSGLWDIMDQNEGVSLVECSEKNNAKNVCHYGSPDFSKIDLEHDDKGINPSTSLVMRAEDTWRTLGRKGDGASVITVLLDPAYAYSNKTQKLIGHAGGSKLRRIKSEKKNISSAHGYKRKASKHKLEDFDRARRHKKSRR